MRKSALYKHLYSSRAWRKLRDRKREANPLCEPCERNGKVTAATSVDHIKKHEGDRALFLDWDNLQSICDHCHYSIKAREEKAGPGYDDQGKPLDPEHPWNKAGGGGESQAQAAPAPLAAVSFAKSAVAKGGTG